MIDINNLSFGYKSAEVLFENLNLKLNTGHIYGLLGKNGAGKTTLLRLICGLLFPKEGECRVVREVAAKRSPNFLEEIYLIPEEFYLPSMTIKSYLSVYSPFYKKFDKKIFNKLFSAFSLPVEKRLDEFSYGLKKKFLVAFGLATNCELLILDEPTNGLDIPGKSQFRRILAEMLDEHRTFVIATHQARDMENLIDSVLILDGGKVIFKQELSDVSRKLTIVSGGEPPLAEKVLYREKVMGCQTYLVENDSKSETKIDIELLFNAVTNNAAAINGVFSGEVLNEG